MKIRYLSDLHLEEWPVPDALPSVGEDLVVLAGDINVGKRGIVWAQQMFRDRQVVYVMGNHEYYGADYYHLLGECRVLCKRGNVQLLENDRLDIGEFRILGCTLWTDFLLFGAERYAEALRTARNHMGDYTWIRANGFAIWPQFTADRCAESKRWLTEQITKSYRSHAVGCG